jgi:hypothetical protein
VGSPAEVKVKVEANNLCGSQLGCFDHFGRTGLLSGLLWNGHSLAGKR